MDILFACSELYPLIKTGGLADVAGNLPRALQAAGCSVRIVMPAYHAVLAGMDNADTVETLSDYDDSPVRLLRTVLEDTGIPVYLVDAPALFDRPGNPYSDASHRDWDDNAQRFGLFAKVVSEMALGCLQLDWQPDIVHCNDWHTGLIPVFLANAAKRPATVFTIHNLAYQGLFPFSEFERLRLPATVKGIELRDFRGLEFHRQLSFIKGGVVFADAVTTVSPGYAREVLQPDLGCGLDGALRYRGAKFSGILNGIDTEIWNPRDDPFICSHYSSKSLYRKAPNKLALLQVCQLPLNSGNMLLGMVSRLSEQKGVDILLAALPRLMKLPVNLLVLGSGDEKIENSLLAASAQYPDRVAVKVGYDEAFAHRVIAGADVLLIPSRYEPCGLTQMYSQRYGTIPLARAVGGLADTVVDLSAGVEATGVLFAEYSTDELVTAVGRVLELHHDSSSWRRVQRNGMAADFSWRCSAQHYLELYSSLVHQRDSGLRIADKKTPVNS